MLLRRPPVGHRFTRIFIAQFIEAEVEKVRELARRCDCLRPAREQSHHFIGRFEVPLGVGIEQISCGRDRHLLADTGDDILQRPAVGCVIMDVIGRKDRATMLLCEPVETLDSRSVAAVVEPACRDMMK